MMSSGSGSSLSPSSGCQWQTPVSTHKNAECSDGAPELTKSNANSMSLNFATAFTLAANAAVQRPRDHVSSAAHVHNEMARLRRASDWVSRSAATACSAS
jgi:hypothetical protein